MSGLRLADDLVLPLEAVTETIAIIAKRRVGKSNAAVVLAEAMYDQAIPWCAIDPKGDWWGIRSSADGTEAGLSVAVFGGKHADLALSPDAGTYMADLIATERITCVLDVSQFNKGEQIRFLHAFATRLLHVNEEPLHLFFEECDDYIPQSAMSIREPDARQISEIQLVRAFSRLIRHGGFKGIGCTLITQRVALVSKNVLSQVETFLLLRTLEPLDLKQVEARVKGHPQAKEILASLPALKVGEAWVYSPAFLETVQRVERFDQRRTFDSGRTPKMGEKRVEPKRLADVDLDQISKAMEDFIAEAEANDPTKLRAEIARLQRELRDVPPPPPAEPQIVKVPVLDDDALKLVELLNENTEGLGQRVDALIDAARSLLSDVVTTIAVPDPPAPAPAAPRSRPEKALVKIAPAEPAPAKTPPSARRGTGSGDPNLPGGERAVLIAIAQVGDASREQIGLLTGYKRSTRNTYLQRLGAQGYVVEVGKMFRATDAGMDALGSSYEPLPTGAALRDYWLNKLPAGEAKVLRVLVDDYPSTVDREALSDITGFARSTRNTYLQRLAARTLVEYIGGEPRAAAFLFEED